MNGLTVDLLAPAQEAHYQRFVAAHPRALFHHTGEWRDLLVRSLGITPRVLAAWRDETLVGAIPLFEVVTPFQGRRLLGAPVCRRLPLLADSPVTASRLVAATAELGRELGCASVELRCGAPFPTAPEFAVHHEFLNFTIDLTDGCDALWARVHPRSVRQAVRRARRDGVLVEEASPGDPAAYRTAFHLAAQTRRRQGAPTLPGELFDSLADLALQTRRVHLFLARYAGQPVAAAIVLRHRRVAHLFDAVSVTDRGLLRRRPNHALLWTAIQAAAADGCTTFDLGPNHRLNEGLSAYKHYWAATADEVPHQYLSLHRPHVRPPDITHPVYRLARAALQRVPTAIHRHLGPLLALEAF